MTPATETVDQLHLRARGRNERIFRGALGQLPAQHRDILVRLYVDGQSVTDASREMRLDGRQFRNALRQAQGAFTDIIGASLRG